jgi:hypothetical protein
VTFNKKRQCCCNADTGPKYLEVFPEIDSTSSEKQLSGTYSYWIFLGDVANEPGTSRPAYDTVIFNVLSSTQNTNATSDIEYLDFTNTVFISTGRFDCAANGESSWKELSSNSGENGQGIALARRGFTWSFSSRFLTESQLFALDENRIRVYRPGPSSDFAPRAFDNGYFFVSNQYNATPAISDTLTRSDGETFNYVVYPKVCANLPDRIIDEDGVVWFDFSAHFPATVTLTWSGSGSVIVREGPQTNAPRQTKSYAISYTATYEKIVLDNGTGQTSVCKYVKSNQSGELPNGRHLLGPRVDFTVTFEGPDGPYDIVYQVGLIDEAPDVIFASQNRYNGFTDIFGTFTPLPGREYTYQRHGARLNKNFSQNTDACYLYCGDCSGGGGSVAAFDKTPYNFAGTSVTDKNSNAFLARFPFGEVSFTPSQAPPYQIEDDNTTGDEIPTSGLGEPFILGWAPVLSWSDDAGSGSVTFEIEDHTYPNGPDTFFSQLPDLRCDDTFGAIDFYIGFLGVVAPGEGNTPIEADVQFLSFPFSSALSRSKSLLISSIS